MDELNVDVKVSKYFDMLQNKIKELISQNGEYKGIDPQQFNDLIFTQGDTQRDDQALGELKEFIKKAAQRGDDLEKVAKQVLNQYTTRVKTNAFDKDNINDIPNQLQQEKAFKYLKSYEKFK